MARRNPWLIVAGGVVGLVCVLIAGVVGYWRYANQRPTYPAPNIVMPVPNAYDDYVAAGQLCKAAGGEIGRASCRERVKNPGGAGIVDKDIKITLKQMLRDIIGIRVNRAKKSGLVNIT